MTDPTALTVAELSTLLGAARRSRRGEALDAHLAAIAADGPPSFDGRPDAVNAWVRLYEEDAVAAADRADARLRRAPTPPPLCGIPIGLKDLYAVAGKPLTASSRAVALEPDADCDVWARLESAGAVLVGHLHTHECAAGGSTDQVGNPWALERTPGGSSGGSAAALAAGMIPLADRHRHGRLAAHPVGPVGDLDDQADARRAAAARASSRSAAASITPGRWRARSPTARSRWRRCRRGGRRRARCAARGSRPRRGWRWSTAIRTCSRASSARSKPAARSAPSWSSRRRPRAALDLGSDFLDVLSTDMLGHHRRFGTDWARLRTSTRDLLEYAEQRAMTRRGVRRHPAAPHAS